MVAKRQLLEKDHFQESVLLVHIESGFLEVSAFTILLQAICPHKLLGNSFLSVSCFMLEIPGTQKDTTASGF